MIPTPRDIRRMTSAEFRAVLDSMTTEREWEALNAAFEASEPRPMRTRNSKKDGSLCARCHVQPEVPGKSWCRECKNEATRRWRRSAAGQAEVVRRRATYVPAVPKYTVTCKVCGTERPTPDPNTIYCSQGCRESVHRWRRRPSVVHYARRQEILARDGWHCYLCDTAIDRSLRWPHALSASVDHVMPIAVGGTDRSENLRATHWQCNSNKGDDLPPWWVAA